MASLARASRPSKGVVYATIPAAIESAKQNMTEFQRETLCNLAQNPGIGHLQAIVERKGIVCGKSCKGGIREPWRIPAHADCTKGLEVNVRHTRSGIPDELMPLVRSMIVVKRQGGLYPYHGQNTCKTEIPVSYWNSPGWCSQTTARDRDGDQ